MQRWIADDNPAQGANELRLWHFLLAAGHTFDKLRIAEFNFYLAELFAYRVLDGLDDVQQYAGVKNPQTALQIMRGQPPMSPAVTLEEMQELHDEPLQLAKS
ncbi:hypothetical protein KC973_02615, partial [Candidatus Saccharibacteria bacterium]|nr:hypothetical protein [Candidatus Saccharibacteria bacterium]